MAIPQNAQTIYSYLLGIGLTPTAASGVLGNIEQESGGNPSSVGSGGCGLIGWTPCSVPVGNLSAQLTALGQYIASNGGVTALNNASTSPTAAAQAFMDEERCLGYNTDPYGTCNLGNRASSAAAVLTAAQTGNWTSSGSATLASEQTGSSASDCVWNLSGPSLPVVGSVGSMCVISRGQVKALLGGLSIAAGGLILATGVFMIFEASKTGRATTRAMTTALSDRSPLGYVANRTVRRGARRRSPAGSGSSQTGRRTSTPQEREASAQRRAEEREQYAQNREAERRYRSASRGRSADISDIPYGGGFASDTIARGAETPVSTGNRRHRERRPRTRAA